MSIYNSAIINFRSCKILLLCSSFFLSCNSNNLELGIEFSTPENEYKKEIKQAVLNGKLGRDSSEFQIQTYKPFKINNTLFKLKIYINSLDEPYTGPLRDYSFDLRIQKASSFTNDSTKCILQNLFMEGQEVISKENFNFIKQYLDSKYGKGKERYEVIYDSKYLNYDYQTDKFKVTLYRNLDEDVKIEEAFKNKLLNAIYYNANLEFKSNLYDELLIKEKEAAIKRLKPNDILELNFKEPYVSPDKFGGRINVPMLQANYKTTLLNKSIIQCKGDLLLLNVYGDLLKSIEYENVIFGAPIPPPGDIYTSYGLNFNFSGNGNENNKIRNLILSKIKVKAKFNVKAIVFDDGSVLK